MPELCDWQSGVETRASMSLLPWLNWMLVAAGVVLGLLPRTSPRLAPFFIPALAFKIFCSVALGLLYLHVFRQGDTFRFFHDGALLAGWAAAQPLEFAAFLWQSNDTFSVWHQLAITEPRSLFFTKVLSLICLLAESNYWLCALWLALISFVSSWLLVQRLAGLHPQYTVSFVVAILFWPSVIFWSSGVLKETLALAAIFWLVRLALEWDATPKFTFAILLQALFCFWIAWSLKYYWIALLAPFLILVAARGYKHFWRFAAVAAVLLGVMLVWHPNLNPTRILHVITDNYYQYHFLTGGNNTFHFFNLQPTWVSVLSHSPAAVFSGLFRPFVWEAKTFFHVLAAVENAGLLLLTLYALARFRLPSSVRGWMLPLLGYALVECTFLTLSTPSWGTLTRYRVGMLPFFLLFVLLANASLQQFLQRKSD